MTSEPDFWPAVAGQPPARRRETVKRLYQLEAPRTPQYLPDLVKPTGKQLAYLRINALELFYGGAGGGGKTTAGLMGALQYVDVPRYAALILRRTYVDLALPGATMDVARRWLAGTDARWKESEHTWYFPLPGGGESSLTFGHLDHKDAEQRYKSAEFQYIFFDELTDFTEQQYRFLFTRLRRPESGYFGGSRLDGMSIGQVPLRMRAASNPGGKGHAWVKRRLVDQATRDRRVFIPAMMDDNPHLDVASYREALAELPPTLRLRIERGDWETSESGALFNRAWYEQRILPASAALPQSVARVRVWDIAATEPWEGNLDPDWTVGMLISKRRDGRGVVIEDVMRFREDPGRVEEVIEITARDVDGYRVAVRLEQEPGASGKIAAAAILDRLDGFDAKATTVSGNKEVRARPAAAMASRGRIWLVDGPWVGDFLDEVNDFPAGGHDDQVDAQSAGVEYLRQTQPATVGSLTGQQLPR